MAEKPIPGQKESELILLIAERASQLALERDRGPGRELDLWLEAEAQIKRERGMDKTRRG